MSRIARTQDSRDDNHQAVRIVVADRNRMASHLLADVLSRIPHVAIAAVVNPSQILESIADAKPRIVILTAEIDHEPTGGIQIAASLHAHAPEVRTIMLVDSGDRETVVEAFRAGVKGIFCRAESLDNLGKCIKRVDEGQIWIDNNQLLFLLETLIASAPYRVVDARGRELLSGRELEVVQLAVKGYINREIADRMKLSEHTVKNYMFRAFDKLGVSNRVEMLFYVLSQSHVGPTMAPTSKPIEKGSAIANLLEEAEAGSVSAEMDLGIKYHFGTGVGRSKRNAYFWLRVAEERAKEIASESRAALRTLAPSMTPAETEAMERRIQEWLDTYRKKISKDRNVDATEKIGGRPVEVPPLSKTG
jgi:two-component system, NarL family, nitrate/nitrite response regulator NarL